MEQIFRFNELGVGHRVKVKGKLNDDGTFAALEVGVKSPDDQVSIESAIQQIDRQNHILRLLNREIAVPDDVSIKDVNREDIGWKNLKAGDFVKLKGLYAGDKGLMPMKIRMQETTGFTIDELQGNIDQIDRDQKTLQLVGFTVAVNERTTIEGL